MYWIIGLILSSVAFLLFAGPLAMYIHEKETGKDCDNLFRAYIELYKQDEWLPKAIVSAAAVLSFVTFLAWPLFILFAIFATALYFIGSSRTIKSGFTHVMDNIKAAFEENNYAKDTKERN